MDKVSLISNLHRFLIAKVKEMPLKQYSVELQSLGVRMPRNIIGRKGGAGPSEGQVLIINGHYINVPTQSWFVEKSPYSITQEGRLYVLFREGVPVCEVHIPMRPTYYDLQTADGVRLEKIALLHGKDCFASTVFQDCVYWGTEKQCKFCGIGLSLDHGTTVLEKKPDDLGYAAQQACRLDSVAHVTLTSGTWKDTRMGMQHLCRCVNAIKSFAGLPVHIQISPPEDMDDFKRLKQAGVDTVGVHIESCDPAVLQNSSPGKARLGLETYMHSWEIAVELFGKNQVSSFIIAGMGESSDSILEGAEQMARLGVFPYLLSLRPVPGTPFEDMQPPSPQKMMALYEGVSKILCKYGLSSKKSKAGCVRCGACSALVLFEE